MKRGDLASLRIEDLEEQLDSFDGSERRRALGELGKRIQAGDIRIPHLKNEVNLHYHKLFSCNKNSGSTERIAWEARKYGLTAAGIVDFDVLDGMEEFLSAGEIIGLRCTAALETRVFITEYMEHVINSPNEPGISYFMGAGCFRDPAKGTRAEEILNWMRNTTRRRNLQVASHVNGYLDSVQIDYDADVIPLTPSGNATERHMLCAYDARSREVFADDPSRLASFWAAKLDVPRDDAAALLANTPEFHERMRSRLMKFGAVGYVRPTHETFPKIETVVEMIQGIDALPTATWNDGTNPGEADMLAMLELLVSKGIVAMNLIPDRVWNIEDPDEKRTKVENLGKAVSAAKEMDFPLCVGTEMNKGGLPFVDNFAAPELQPYVQDFLEGAYFFWGHTFLARNAGIGYASEWAESYFGASRKKKNEFYAKIGRLADPQKSKAQIEGRDFKSASPDNVVQTLE